MDLKIKEISAKIAVHLKHFETDPNINKPRDNRLKTTPYWMTEAGVNGRWISITYINYQGYTSLTKAEAAKYLAWLDAGNVGKHWEALK